MKGPNPWHPYVMSRASLGKWLPGTGLLGFWVVTRGLLLAGLYALEDAGDGVMPLVFGWVREMLAGRSPYHDSGVAYPPLAMFFFALIGVGEDSADGYAGRFAAAMLIVDFAGLCIAFRADRQGRRYAAPAYVLGLLCVGPILALWRYDLLPAIFHLAAGLCLLGGLRRLSWGLLGVGIAFKPYLAVVLPLWAVWEVKAGRPSIRSRLIEGAVFASLPSVVAAFAMLPLSGFDFSSAYTFQASRGLQVESGPAVVLAELAKADLSTQRAVFSNECLCWERTGPSAGLLSGISSGLVAVGLALIVLLIWRRESTEQILTDKVLAGSCAAVVLLLLVYRVFSPQYIVWALVPFSLMVKSRPGAYGALLLAGAGLIAVYLYPLNYAEVINSSGAGRWLMLIRTGALLAALSLAIPAGSSRILRKSRAFGR